MRIKDSRRGLCADSQDKSWSTSLTVPVFLLHFSSLFLLLFFFAGVSYILSVIFVSLLLSAFYVPLPSTTTMATLYMRRHKRENAGQQNHRRTRPAMFNGCRRFPLRDDPPSATTDHSYFFSLFKCRVQLSRQTTAFYGDEEYTPFFKIRIQFSFCREFSHRYRQQSKGDLASWRKMFCLCLVGRLECCRSETIIRNGAIKNVAEDYPRTGHLKQCVNRTKVIWSFLSLSLSASS